MPVLTLVIIFSANILKVMRAQMLETLTSDYVRTARAKGLGSKAVNLKHARRNALLPIVTLTGFTAINLLAGAIITETIFAYPGVGQWVGSAAQNLDIRRSWALRCSRPSSWWASAPSPISFTGWWIRVCASTEL